MAGDGHSASGDMVRCGLAPDVDQRGRRRCRRRLRRPLRERGTVMTTPTTVSALDVGRIDHAEAMRITATENSRLLDQLRQLTPGDWAAATDCPRWTVRDMVVHLVASAQAQANPIEFGRQVWTGRKLTAQIGGSHWVDGLNEAQLRARRDWTAEKLTRRWEKAAAAGLAPRRPQPAPIRALALPPPGAAPAP